MRRRPVRAILAWSIASLLCAVGSVQAVQIFEFKLEGTAQSNFPLPAPVGTPPTYTTPWIGTVRVETVDGGDGIYTGDRLLLVQLRSTIPGARNGPVYGVNFDVTGLTPPMYLYQYPSVTLRGGQLTSFDVVLSLAGNPQEGIEYLSGLNAGYGDYYGGISAAGFLTPVPEPEMYSLLLTGLLSIGAIHRRESVRKKLFGI